MSFFDDFTNALYEQIKIITDLQESNIFFSHTNGPEPLGTYCTINVLSLDQVNTDYTGTLTDDDELLWIRTEFECNVKFSFYGSSSRGAAADLYNAFSNVVHLENLLRNKISLMRKGTVQFSPDKRETKWVNRYTLEVVFAFAALTKQPIDVIDTIVFTDLIGQVHTIP